MAVDHSKRPNNVKQGNKKLQPMGRNWCTKKDTKFEVFGGVKLAMDHCLSRSLTVRAHRAIRWFDPNANALSTSNNAA